MPIKRLTIIGVGLIGGSLARALKRARACAEIIGCDVTGAEKAIAWGVTDSFYREIGTAVKGAEMVVIQAHRAGNVVSPISTSIRY